MADLNPTRGREQAGFRPVLVVSHDIFNRGPSGLVIALPVTSTLRGIPSQILLGAPEGGLGKTSVAMCEGIRSIAKERLVKRRGMVSARTLISVEDVLRTLLQL
ncbi:MAG: type II toxin-antitoxin system PemK/MazF family toxin [Nitrospirae bacterium]|nr:type II toxin-antitoxin system PemK/MazF family toxin [Nitrospirota bacterium]